MFAARRRFVAGAYGDLGAAIARALVASGVRVVVAGRDPGKLRDARARSLGDDALAVALDASDVASIRAAVGRGRGALGRRSTSW